MPVITESNFEDIEEEAWPPPGLPDYRYRGPEAEAIEERGLIPIKISAASLRLEFDGCDLDFVRNVCKGACCRPRPFSYACSTVHPTERAALEGAGAKVRRNLLVLNDDKTCPFHMADGLCQAHILGVKSFDCWVAPMILNSNGTMIVANWFKSMPCFKAGRRLPLYKCYPTALAMILGDEGQKALDAHLDAGGGDIIVGLTPLVHQKMCLERHAVGWSILQMKEERKEAERLERAAIDARKAARKARAALPVLG